MKSETEILNFLYLNDIMPPFKFETLLDLIQTKLDNYNISKGTLNYVENQINFIRSQLAEFESVFEEYDFTKANKNKSLSEIIDILKKQQMKNTTNYKIISKQEQPQNVLNHKQICDKIHNLYKTKNHDYGNSFHKSFEEYGLPMAAIRLGDKYNRFKILINKNNQVTDESLKDTLLDLANYAIMTIMELETHEKGENNV